MQNERDKIVTKTVIHEKNQVEKKILQFVIQSSFFFQVTEQKTDRLVNSTRDILQNIYKQVQSKLYFPNQ